MSEKNIKKNILTAISGLLSNEADLRKASEDRLKALEFTEEYSMALIDIIMDFGEHTEERLLASILLKHYIINYWTRSNINDSTVITHEIKEKIKKFLPVGIGDSNKKISLCTAQIMAQIAVFDYPQNWPNMMNLVHQMLQTASKEQVEGTIGFLRECLPYNIFTELNSSIYNSLHEIISNVKFSTSSRATVIYLLTRYLLVDLEKCTSTENEQVLNNVIKKYCELLCIQLSQPYSPTSDFQLKSEIIGSGFVQFLYCNKINDANHVIISFLPIVWEILSKCTVEYTLIIGSNDRTRKVPCDTDEPEGSPQYFMKLVNNIFVLVQQISSNPSMNKHLIPFLPDILYSTIVFMSITPEMEADFIDCEDSYCSDEFSSTVNKTLRTDLRVLLGLIKANLSSDKYYAALCIAINKLLGSNYEIKPEDTFNWRINESIMAIIGCLADLFKDHRHTNVSFNIFVYLRNASLVVNECRNILLIARIMLVVGKFSCCMSVEQIVQQLNAFCVHLRSDQHILRNAAIRALNYHCQRITNPRGICYQHVSEEAQNQHLEAFAKVFNNLLDCLISVSQFLKPIIFGTTIRNIYDITNMNPTLTVNFAERLVIFILNTLQKNTQNALIICRCRKLIIGLSKNKMCGEFVQSSLMPPLINFVYLNNENPTSDKSEAVAVGLYILSTLIEYACSETIKNALFVQAYTLVIDIINSSEEISVIETGIRCLCMFHFKSSMQIVAIDKERRLDAVMTVIHRLMEINREETACQHIDKLVISTEKAFGSMFHQHVEKLVKCTLSKLNLAHKYNVKESFNTIFLNFLYYNYELIIEILRRVPGPTGDSALKHIFDLILPFEYNASVYSRYLYTMVLCSLLEQAVSCEDSRLAGITITEIVSRTEKKETPLVSFLFEALVKIFFAQRRCVGSESFDEDDEEYIEFETESDVFEENEEFIDLSVYCNDMENTINEPYMEAYLLNYMRTFSRQDYFQTIVENSLDPVKKQKLYEFISIPRDEPVQYY